MRNVLHEIGLDNKETAAYIAVLELGQAHILDISKKAGIPRATVYICIEKLMREGLVSSILKGKRHYYMAENPAKIKQRIEQQQDKVAKLIPQLEYLYSKSAHRPVIRAYEGVEGIRAMFEDMHASVPEGGTYDVILNSRDEFAAIGEIYNSYIAKRIKRNIWIRIISEKSELTRDWIKKQQETLRQVKFLPRGQHFSVSYHIYGDKVSMFSLQGPVVGVIIENKEIADMERLQFDYMWKALK